MASFLLVKRCAHAEHCQTRFFYTYASLLLLDCIYEIVDLPETIFGRLISLLFFIIYPYENLVALLSLLYILFLYFLINTFIFN